MARVVIPRIIWQTWKTRDVPPKWLPSVASIAKHMPEWEHRLRTDEDNRELVAREFPFFLSTYDSYPYPIQRADAVRPMYLYKYGGLYLDLDIELVAPLDDLFTDDDYDLFLVRSGNLKGYITNSFMASKPGNPVWLHCLQEMQRGAPWWAIEKHLYILQSTGPALIDRVIRSSEARYLLLDSELVNPYSMCDTTYSHPTALTRPLEGSSWVDWRGSIYRTCYCQGQYILPIVLVLLLLLLLGLWHWIRRPR
jgi:mannosyltransferase OCH1-like enzyme